MAILHRLTAALRTRVSSRSEVRDTPRRPEFYDGSEKPGFVPPARYARGKKATAGVAADGHVATPAATCAVAQIGC